MLPRDWEIKLVDLNVEVLTNATILWADMVFISAMIVQENSAMEVVARAKALGKIVVVGGPLFTSHPEKFEIIDHLVLNEAEVTLPSFLTDLENSNPQHIYSDWTKPAITQTPIPMWSLINLSHYASMLLQYSRGCPFDCEFCDITTLFGRVPRVKTPEQMIGGVSILI